MAVFPSLPFSAVLLVFGSVLLPVVSSCRVEAIFNFGDSNSDTGGFWAAFPSQSVPFGMTYFKNPSGRASDGRLLIDFLAQALGMPMLSPYLQSVGSDFRHGANFATLASMVLLPNTSVFVTGISPFSLGIQLNQMKEFKARVLDTTDDRGSLPAHDIFGKSLYTINIGQNDFTSNLATIGIEGVQKYLPQVVEQIAWTIHELYALGGRIFLVFNLAPIGCYPAFLVELPHSDNDLDAYGCMTSYNDAVLRYNEMLHEALRRTRTILPDVQVVYVDTSSFILDLFRKPHEFGLMYGTKACCGHGGGAYNFDPKLYCGNSKVIDGVTVTATACVNPEMYVSWDGIHATEAANRLVASAILNGTYSDPPFPLSDLCPPEPNCLTRIPVDSSNQVGSYLLSSTGNISLICEV